MIYKDRRNNMHRFSLFSLLILFVICFFATANAGYFDSVEKIKADAHNTAEIARAAGEPEDSPTIKTQKKRYTEAQNQIDSELDMLSRVVYFEAGSSWLSDRHQQLVARVLLNRCADPRFPGTIKENVYRKGQYACAKRLYSVTRDQIPDRCYKNAKIAAYDSLECPSDVIFQSQKKQGRGTYEKIGNTYFCYG